jgi:D-glucuronyl C5-epimerase-like protein
MQRECSIAVVRGRLLGLTLAAVLLVPASAGAAPVLVMGHGGHVTRANDPFLRSPGQPPVTPAPAPAPAPTPTVDGGSSRPSPRADAARAKPRPRPPQRNVVSELARLYRTHQLDAADYGHSSASWGAALAAVKHLHGTRATELRAVIENLHGIAAAGELTPSRLPVLFLTLDRNRQWWTTGPVPIPGQDIEFTGSQLVWEYYPGQGIELQVLASFGKADGLYTAGESSYPQMQELLGEMIPLAAQRAGQLAWEYYFHFAGGSPPWVSAMAQGTAIEALTRAAQAFGPGSGPGGSSGQTYLQIAQRALGIFTIPPPLGVQVATPAGARYLQYSSAPRTDIINAFLQSLIGLYDFAQFSGSPEAQRLFAAGDAQARAELPSFDTGAWSLYQPGIEDSLDYHTLVTGFLDQLCARTKAAVYCTTAQHFHAYLTTPPTLRLLTSRARARSPIRLQFALSKYSHVGIVVTRGSQNVFLTSADFPYGVDTIDVPALAPGSYTLRLGATDLPGNFNRTVAMLLVARQPR